MLFAIDLAHFVTDFLIAIGQFSSSVSIAEVECIAAVVRGLESFVYTKFCVWKLFSQCGGPLCTLKHFQLQRYRSNGETNGTNLQILRLQLFNIIFMTGSTKAGGF